MPHGSTLSAPRTRETGVIAAFRATQLLLLVVISFPGSADAETLVVEPVADGSTWNIARFPASFAPIENKDFLIMGGLQQSLGFAINPAKITLSAFTSVNYAKDTQGLTYYNKVAPSVGGKLEFSPVPEVSVELGGGYAWEDRFRTKNGSSGTFGFVNWDGNWDFGPEILNLGPFGRYGYTIDTWGELRYPSAHTEAEQTDLVFRGSTTVDAHWYELRYDVKALIRFATRVQLGYSADTAGLDYNNVVAPATGLVAKLSGLLEGLEVGTLAALDYRPNTRRARTGLIGFVGCSASWP